MSRRDNVIYLADHLRPRSSLMPWIWVSVIAASLLLAAFLGAHNG